MHDDVIVAQAAVEAAEKALKAARDKLQATRAQIYRESKFELRVGVWEIDAWYNDVDNLWILAAYNPKSLEYDRIRLPWTVALEMIRRLAEKYDGHQVHL